MASDGVRRAAVFTTSAWGGYSGCAQYQEDIVRARAAVGDGAPELVKLRQFFDHPLLVEMFADAIAAAAATLPESLRAEAPAGVHRAFDTGARRRPVRAGSVLPARFSYTAGLVAAAAGYPTTTWSGSPGRVRRRFRGWNPMSQNISRRWPSRAPRPCWSARSGSSPTTSRWCGTSTTNCASRPTSSGSRWRGRRRPTRSAASPGWSSISSTKCATAANPRGWLAPSRFRATAPVSTAGSARRIVQAQCQAECRIAVTAAIRAERTTDASGRSASLAI